MTTSESVRYGDEIRLRHVATNVLLRSVVTTYSHLGGSGQQIVGASGIEDANSVWLVKPAHGSADNALSQEPIRHGDVIRLEHVRTGRNLHSHSSQSPITEQQEVTAYGTNGEGDKSDNWIVDLDELGVWQRDVPMRLRFEGNGQYLHSHSGFSDPKLTAGLQEVTAFDRKDDSNNLWMAVYEDVAVAQDAAGKIGSELNVSRRAPAAEICLDAERYAAALVRFFRNTTRDELCFAIYAPWGRGKTQLAELLKKRLEDNSPSKEKPTKVVFFHAWKYPTTPEVWVHLYETLADAAAANPVLAFARNMRAGIARNGLWPLFLAMCALVFAILPKIAAAEGAWAILSPVLGIGGILFFILLARGIRGTAKRLARDYLSAVRHDEKLGLQATIGKDLKALLEGWLPREFPFNAWFIFGTVGLLVLASWSILHWFDFGLRWFDNIRETPTAPTPGGPIVVVVLWILVIVAGLIVWGYRDAPENVLLVVDDLDRCDLSHLLHIIESVKLLSEEKSVRSRLQVAMLVEEQVLHAAIRQKFGKLWNEESFTTESQSDTGKMREADVIRDTIEKLFSAHLRLHGLKMWEVRDLVYGFGVDAQEEAKKLRDAARERDVKMRSTGDYLRSRTPEAQSHSQSGRTARSANGESVDAGSARLKISLTPDEKNAIWDALRATGFKDEKRVWGPRAVRALTFRFQLARLLLEELGIQVGPKRLANLVVARSIDLNTQVDDANPTVTSVVKQVT